MLIKTRKKSLPSSQRSREHLNMQSEKQLQQQVLAWLRFNRFLCWHVPNMGFFNRKTNRYNIVSSDHVAGIPDIHVILPGGEVVFIELKSEKGKLSPAQKAMLEKLASLGHSTFVARDLQTVERYFKETGLIK